MTALLLEAVPVSSHCAGRRWKVADESQLTRLIAVVAMGQATRAAVVIQELLPASPQFTAPELVDEAVRTLTVQGKSQVPRVGYPRWQRDGFIFEAISWIAARQELGANGVLKDPHTSATSQGIDGLLLELEPGTTQIRKACVFEDKCTDDPRGTFTGRVLPAFKDRHLNKRSAELVACAAALIKSTGAGDDIAIQSSARVLDLAFRQYRAAFALPPEFDADEKRAALFERYDEIDKIGADQRVAASFITTTPSMRGWFDHIASESIAYLRSL